MNASSTALALLVASLGRGKAFLEHRSSRRVRLHPHRLDDRFAVPSGIVRRAVVDRDTPWGASRIEVHDVFCGNLQPGFPSCAFLELGRPRHARSIASWERVVGGRMPTDHPVQWAWRLWSNASIRAANAPHRPCVSPRQSRRSSGTLIAFGQLKHRDRLVSATAPV